MRLGYLLFDAFMDSSVKYGVEMSVEMMHLSTS